MISYLIGVFYLITLVLDLQVYKCIRVTLIHDQYVNFDNLSNDTNEITYKRVEICTLDGESTFANYGQFHIQEADFMYIKESRW